jgi:hypothetical protein
MTRTTKQEFFGFFRQRLANLKQIEALEPAVKTGSAASFSPELNILLSAELDALAKYWAINQNSIYSQEPDKRLGEFLSRHSHPAWSYCSHLDLIRRASKESREARQGHRPTGKELPDPSRQLADLDRILHEDLGLLVWTHSDISWQHDPSFDFLSQSSKISAAGIPVEWLRRSRYGEILYRHYRSGWIHALDPDPELHTEFHHILDREHSPHSLWHNNARVFAIPTEFILRSLEAALKAFKAATPDGAEIVLRP